MNKKTIILLAITFCLLLSIAVMPLLSDYLQTKKEKEKIFSSFTQDLITEIKLSKNDQSLMLVKKGSEWQVNGKHADESKVTSLLSNVSNLAVDSIVAKTKENYDSYGLGSASATLYVFQDSNKTISLQVGTTANSGSGMYVTREGSDDVILTTGPLLPDSGVSLNDWISKDIMHFQSDAFQKLVVSGFENFEVNKIASDSYTLNKFGVEKKLTQEKANQAIGALTSLSGIRLASDGEVSTYAKSNNKIGIHVVDSTNKEIGSVSVVKSDSNYLVETKDKNILIVNDYTLSPVFSLFND